MPYSPIEHYGIIGNGVTTALIRRDGAIDWLCLPYQDSPSVFAALLDDERGGRFAVRPGGEVDAAQEYLPGTNVLRSRLRTPEGEAELIDFMPMGPTAEAWPQYRRCLLRRLHVYRGAMTFRIECRARFDYGRRRPEWSPLGPYRVRMTAGDESLVLECSEPVEWAAETGTVMLSAGDSLWFRLGYGEPDVGDLESRRLEGLLDETTGYWRGWLADARRGKYPTRGFWQAQLDRSALILKLLQNEETGAIAAAPTTSLPAIVHGERNWDYRFSWLRDTSMTLYALAELGHIGEMGAYMRWVDAVVGSGDLDDLSVVYHLSRPVPPEGEAELGHLSGYKGSEPVRIGQYVVHQRQHDVYGEVLETLFMASRFVGRIDPDNWGRVRPLVDRACEIWRERDSGIWEMRAEPRHFTHSKLMCWVALDRGIKIAEHYGLEAPLDRWRSEREAVEKDILERGYNSHRGSFVQHYEGEEVDAALLQIPLMGFLPVDDPRVAGTIRRIEEDLLAEGVILRYRNEDGLPGQEHGFLICLFWYLNCLILQGRLDEVEGYLREVDRYASPLGLFGEQYDPVFGQITGNFPQAYSHLGHTITVLAYLDARYRPPLPPKPGPVQRLRRLFRPLWLNPPVAGRATDGGGGAPAERLKRTMNELRGMFYDGHRQRVDYARIQGAEYYDVFKGVVADLAAFDPGRLETDAERIAFWTNLFNVIVIHGVIELGVRASVREVPLFFSRICYQVGSDTFTPDDIEHGILRGNARPPHRLARRFGRNDPRHAYRVRQPDPRIHFALVCASRTCPPVEAYDPECLDSQLDESARVFINGTTRFEPERGVVHISEIFRWYWRDFGFTAPQMLRYLAGYLYNQENAAAIAARSERLRIAFDPYDWRLNR